MSWWNRRRVPSVWERIPIFLHEASNAKMIFKVFLADRRWNSGLAEKTGFLTSQIASYNVLPFKNWIPMPAGSLNKMADYLQTIFQKAFESDNVWISIKISPSSVNKDSNNDNQHWCWVTGLLQTILSELTMTRFTEAYMRRLARLS